MLHFEVEEKDILGMAYLIDSTIVGWRNETFERVSEQVSEESKWEFTNHLYSVT